ncbi:non-ribosomal peptide synthetase [Methanobacterium alcaliphilum]|uniref:non-ribosomal peptide synthetase n=1 Tax=Methanobacterium alcaliphilum TaxID=392018 RepID=UPI002009FB7F|nr:non-ribosomal peptide synthetase [Methanobacterium alcaliphilum]MCK9150623.1 amino acid adenylation domain-containing protein [Methanobacterium alcaliphilum]
MDYFDLSNAQKRTIITEISKPGNEAYILSFKLEFPLKDEKYVKKALDIAIDGNIQLRIKKDESMNFMQYYADEKSSCSVIDLSENNNNEINDFIVSFSKKPFKKIFDVPLFEFKLLKTKKEIIVLGRTHHIIMDGTSVNIFAKELKNCILALKKGETYQYPYNPYEDYVEKEKEYISSEKAKNDEDFWLSNLEGYSNDWYSSEDLNINRSYFYLEDELREKLKKLASVNGEKISPFILALSAVSLYFNKSNCSKDMVWNSVYHGRDFGDNIPFMMGMFVNMMPLRLVYDKRRSFKEALLYTKSVLKNGLSHGKLSFNKYGPKLQQKGIDPAMLSMYSMVSNSTDSEVEFLFNNSKSEFPFHIRVNPSLKDKDGLQLLVIEYNAGCFSDEQISIIVENIRKLLYILADNHDVICDDLEIETSDFHRAEKYFKKLFKNTDGATVISQDLSGKEEDGFFKKTSTRIEKTMIEEFCRNSDITPNNLFLSAVQFALVKFVFAKNILISILSNNNCRELPFAINIDTDKTTQEYLNIINELFLEVVDYDYYPFSHIFSENYIAPEFIYAFDPSNGENYNLNPNQHKLGLFVEDDKKEFNITTHYNDAIYSKELMDTFTESVNVLINKLMENPGEQLKNISILENDKKEDKFLFTPVEEPLLNRLFEKRVTLSRNEIALIADDGELTYDELNRKANRIANALIKKGVDLEDRILFILKRDSRLIAAMLGIVKAGCAFIPVDPEYPEERIMQVIEDSDAKFIITDKELPNALNVDDLLLESNEENPNPKITPENLCYLIYTSGSTGKPKGVMLTHGGITNYVSPDPQNIPIHALLNRARKMISISTVSFIVFLREILATITNGMPVVFANEEQSINPIELVKLFEQTGADAFGATPTRLLQYLEIEEIQKIMPRCKFIIVGGETFPPQLYNMLSKYTYAEIYNSYGPTEITIASHGKLITSDDISAGEPLLNVTDRIMDIDANPLPHNVVGELYVAGAGVARGYWNNEELTKERFINYNGLRYYNTGDLAKRDNTGELYVLGRMDRQIKLRGLRIELGEVENAITDYNGIRSAYVVVKTVHDSEHLCAYFTEKNEIDINSLRNNLLDKLPAYMVPSYFVKMESFPMTPNGKTDLRNLPNPEETDSLLDEIISPENDLEKDIFEMCSDILDTTNFGVITDLFQLGLTSLSVLKLVTKISQKFDLNVNVTSIMRARNIREIAKEVSSASIIEKKHYKIQEFYPLTQNQLGVYFDCVKNPEKLTYNLPKIIRFKDIDSEKLKSALMEVISKHPYIKTRMVMQSGEIYQQRQDDLKISIDIKQGIVDDRIIKDFIKPFSLFEGPLFRFEIYTFMDETVLLSDFHHIMVDGTALNILFNDLGKSYDGVLIDEEEYDGFDLSLEELELEKSQIYSQAQDYFEGKMEDFDSATVISPDLKGKEKDGNLGEIGVSLDKNIVETFCKTNSITPNNLFLAATVFNLTKFVYNKNILISTISNGRSNPNFQNTIAMMVKTLPLALNIDTNTSASDFFDYVENIWLDVLKYEIYPFTRISDKYEIFPEFLYAFHGKIIEDITINGHTFERESLEYEALKFKLSVNIIDTGTRFHLLVQYNDALYSRDLMETFIKSLELVVNKLIQNPRGLLKNISILLEDEKVKEFQVKPVAEPLVNKIFENQVQVSGDRVALISEDGNFTYNELNRKANRIANALIKRGVEIEDRVMFILKRDSRLIATVLGIIKAGCAFIPVDPEYPDDRVNHVLHDSSARYIISSEGFPGALDVDELLMEDNEENPKIQISPENLCYLIYTSGSTGKPKGVMLTHSNISNYLSPDPENCYAHAFVNKARKMLSITTVSFDVFLHETFITLMNGRALVFANDDESKNPLELVKLFKKSGADSFSATPSRMLQYLEIDGICEALSNCKVISVAGEKYPPQLHKKLLDCTSGEIYNVYGPTETTISCNTKHITDINKITVGKPLLNVTEKVMDLDGNPLPCGVIGELYVGGMGVARGYWNREELNREQFISIDGIPYYKTGDFASKEKNGEYNIFGRLDNQIKLRGLRIEIGEIESAISDYNGIKSVTVVVKKVQSQDHLCAYFTYDCEIDIDDLKNELKKRLTKYMVPTIFMPLDKLPQTPNGKTDLKALPEPILKERIYVAPENDIEKFFARAFAEILDIPKVGVTDNFFDLGGTSLLVTKITIEALNQGYEIKYGDVFAHPCPRDLAKVITEAEDSVKEQEAYSYDAINEILEKNTIKNFVNGEIEKLGNVLLTGATGFLGIHILREFLENETGSIYCMLRKGRHTTPENRLKTLLFYYFSENYEELFGSRIHVIEGDITSKADFEKSRGFAIDTVINCAANVKHFAAGTQIEDINIGGVINGVDFCKKKGCKYIQVSTTSVAGESVNNVPSLDTEFDERTIYVGQSLDNKYLSSKFKAERVVLEAINEGLNGKIVRVGNLMARQSDSEFQINFETNGFVNRLRAYAAIERIPYSVLGGKVELTPIDLASRAILLLGQTPQGCTIFHVFNNHQIYIADIVEMMRKVGFIISGAEEDEFEEAFAAAREDDTKQDAISGLVTAMGMGKGKGRALVTVVNDYTIQILYRLGYQWPLISDEYLIMFIKYLKEMNFFD